MSGRRSFTAPVSAVLAVLVVGAVVISACVATDDAAGSSTTLDAPGTTSIPTMATTSTSTTTPPPPRALGFVAVADESDDEERATVDPATSTSSARAMADLQVGDCLQLDSLLLDDAEETVTTEIAEVTVVECPEPHDAEIYALISLDDDPTSRHPGDEHVIAAADRLCLEAFAPYVGARYVDTRLEIVHLRPTVASWARGDRRVMCAVVNAGSGPLVGSVAGTGAGAP